MNAPPALRFHVARANKAIAAAMVARPGQSVCCFGKETIGRR